ncbi:NucA/NucB deoxyribonuclease domain-containing protein [Microbacterium sp. SA39]|uniref:NucA/NucB deoxyribonuclease domain-containing protein n=1 Tax=Microbacterium sp. SA39 TaxID=1263625 RepID=UPI00061F7DC4|nr:hypothetical protein [Microbacterium sp. SA39]KJQ55749.1 hypothetical protein RS85_00452 [Microbacterium sp. SA39]
MQIQHGRVGRRAFAVLGAIAGSMMIVGALAAPAQAAVPAPSTTSAPIEAPAPPDLTAAVSVGDEVEPITVETGDAMRSTQDSCTQAGDQVLCIEMGTEPADVPLDEAGRGDVQPFAMVNVPAWRLEAGVQNQYFANRTNMCGIFSGTLTVHQVTNGVPGAVVGTMQFYNYIYMDTSLNRWANQMRVSPTIITGQAAGTQISGVATCTGGPCVQASQSFPAQAPAAMGNADGESYWEWTGATGTAAYGTPSWSITFKSPGSTTSASLNRPAAQVRCDNAVPGRAVIGCVVPSITPVIRYDGTSFVEFGARVSGAQASGLKGGSSANPLHRMVNATQQAANRNTACPSSLPRPTGKSCDEYPFASTYEGAALSGGLARTQSWCQVALVNPPSTGAAGYSVCMINANENSQAGSLMNSVLFGPSRVIDGDAFYVEIL